jgi:hypothetical protein
LHASHDKLATATGDVLSSESVGLFSPQRVKTVVIVMFHGAAGWLLCAGEDERNRGPTHAAPLACQALIAKVTNQEGEHLAKLLNYPEINSDCGKWTFAHAEGFKFKNMGQLVHIGGHMAALSVPASDKVDVSWNGALTNCLWHAACFGMLRSMSARWELVFDWTKS